MNHNSPIRNDKLLREAYEAGRRNALNEQKGMGMGPAGMSNVRPPKGGIQTRMPGQQPPTPPAGSNWGWSGNALLNIITQNYGQSTAPPNQYLSQVDFDGDGMIGVGDLLHVLDNWAEYGEGGTG